MNPKTNLINCAKNHILFICFLDYHKLYTKIIEIYKSILKFYSYKKCYIYLGFDYNNNLGIDDEEYYNQIIDCINYVFNGQEVKLTTKLNINNGKTKNTQLINKIVNLDYFLIISIDKNITSIKINFNKLQNCKEFIFKNLFFDNLSFLPENLENISLNNYYQYKKNIIMNNLPKGLKKILILNKNNWNYSRENILCDLDGFEINKIVVINFPIDNNNFKFLHDYNILIINKNIESNSKYIDLNNLPYTLKILHLNYNSPLQINKIPSLLEQLPNSIEQLKITYFSKNLLMNLPSNLKKINFDFYLDSNIFEILSVLPNSLEEIKFQRISLDKHMEIFKFKLPLNIKTLIIYNESQIFDFMLYKFLIDNSIKFTIEKKHLFLWKKYLFT